MKTVLLPGSYDPVTKGHFAVLSFAARHFDAVRAVIFVNPDKDCLFPLSDRLAFLRLAAARFPNVTVDADQGLVADYVKRHGIDLIVKGVRDERDYLYEAKMVDWNAAHGAETLLLPASPALKNVSSTTLRERLAKGESIDDLAAPGTADAIRSAYGKLRVDEK